MIRSAKRLCLLSICDPPPNQEACNNMSQEDVKTLSLACPSCGGKMQLSADEEKATCPYCGHKNTVYGYGEDDD